MIERVIIKNYKCIKSADIEFNLFKNIIVGNNGVGKSTLIEAMSLALGYGLNTFEITPHIFNVNAIKEFKKTGVFPEILIEIYFDGEPSELSGNNNSIKEVKNGLYLRISFDEAYSNLYETEKSNNPDADIPCELYKKERYWFSMQPVKQYNMPYTIQIVDTSSSYFSSSSNQYINQLIEKYLGDDDTIAIRSALRSLKGSFDGNNGMQNVNKKIQGDKPDMSISIDVTSRLDRRDILCPFIREIPVSQLGAGEICHLKTLLALGKNGDNSKQRIVIIEEPEAHLSHTMMYEMLQDIVQNVKDGKEQIFITTHNSFVANKLDLSNLIILENLEFQLSIQKLTEDKQLYSFFSKVSHYPTLRMILSKAVILVEGPSDEMLITYHYYKTYERKHPFNDGIELITVGGTTFRAYAHLLSKSKKRVAIITDNDGYNTDVKANSECMEGSLTQRRRLCNLTENIRIFTEEDRTLNTLEPSFVRANINELQELSDFVREKKQPNDTEAELADYMINHKAEWSFKLLVSRDNVNFKVPKYIDDAINWVRENNE